MYKSKNRKINSAEEFCEPAYKSCIMEVFTSKQTGEIDQKISREERKANLVARKQRQVRNQEIEVWAPYPRVSKIVIGPKS